MKFALITLLILSLFMITSCDSKEFENQEHIEVKESELSGTCPTKRSCTTPSCGLWVDENKDGNCDRGH